MHHLPPSEVLHIYTSTVSLLLLPGATPARRPLLLAYPPPRTLRTGEFPLRPPLIPLPPAPRAPTGESMANWRVLAPLALSPSIPTSNPLPSPPPPANSSHPPTGAPRPPAGLAPAHHPDFCPGWAETRPPTTLRAQWMPAARGGRLLGRRLGRGDEAWGSPCQGPLPLIPPCPSHLSAAYRIRVTGRHSSGRGPWSGSSLHILTDIVWGAKLQDAL